MSDTENDLSRSMRVGPPDRLTRNRIAIRWVLLLFAGLLTACSGGHGGPSPPPKPTVTLSSSPTSVAQGSSAALMWSTTNAKSCTASGGWSGNKATSGSTSTGALNATTTYTLTCTGTGGTAAASATVTLTGPSMSVSPSTVNVTAAVNAPVPTANVSVTFTGAPATVYFMASDYTTNGISSVSTPVYMAKSGSFTVTFKYPSGLKPATYTDTDTLLLCSDPQCQTVLAKFPLSVKYTVTAASSAPQVTLDSASLNIQALSIDQDEVPATPDPSQFTFTNFTTPPYVKLSAPTTGGISSLNFVMSDATHGGIAFVMQTPAALGAGTYTTTIKATVCLDSTCVNQIGGYAITLTYKVGNTVTVVGANGYTMTYFPAPAQAIVWKCGSGTPIYISVYTSAPSHPGTIEALNPLTGTTTFSTQPLGGTDVLALSGDGQYLYTGKGEQVLTSTLTAGLSISVVPGSAIESIAVAPGEPQTIAVGGFSFVQIFDGAVARPNALIFNATSGVFDLQWGSTDSVLYGGYFNGAQFPECNFTVDASGVSGPGTCINADLDGFYFANGLGYGPGGLVVNATTWATVTTLSAPNMTLGYFVFPDTSTGKAFAAATNTNNEQCTIQSLRFNLERPNWVKR